jgi:hypothetical protein
MSGPTSSTDGSGTSTLNTNVNENRNTNTNVNDNTNVNQSPSASPRTGDDDQLKQNDQDKKTGLDRADEAAGPHGQHGRDNAREKQQR